MLRFVCSASKLIAVLIGISGGSFRFSTEGPVMAVEN